MPLIELNHLTQCEMSFHNTMVVESLRFKVQEDGTVKVQIVTRVKEGK